MADSQYEEVWRTTEANEHIERLALEHDITIRWGEGYPPLSHARIRTIWTPFCTTGSTYLGALHEIGHVVDPRAKTWCRKAEAKVSTGRKYDPALNWLGESAAWVWAFQHIDVRLLGGLRARDYRFVGACWITYGKDLAGSHLVA